MKDSTCSIPDCTKQARTRGWCSMHYTRWARHGDPHGGRAIVRHESPEATIAAKSERRGDCLVWTGTTTGRYGRIGAHGRYYSIHRYVWEQANGPIPEGMVIDHICHNTFCIELKHLRMVTQKQNMEHLLGPTAANLSSGVRGVTKHKRRWRVQVRHNKELHYGGQFPTLEEAEAAAIALRNKLFTHNDMDRAA